MAISTADYELYVSQVNRGVHIFKNSICTLDIFIYVSYFAHLSAFSELQYCKIIINDCGKKKIFMNALVAYIYHTYSLWSDEKIEYAGFLGFESMTRYA
ncbi:hypothetical protein BLX06_25335 [Bacillus cereus]|uniref:Uncharacterized protein n=1 Tax=Bacillus cereus TaxID=1396 RepID=A0A9X6B573_BACCE|nr:hypothetical protein BLX06_25335 [Bacillus cereus]